MATKVEDPSKIKENREIIQRAINRVRDLADTVQTSRQYWVHGTDCCDDYCETCVYIAVDRERAKASEESRESIVADGGWDDFLSDHSSFCEECGKQLTYALTNFGLEYELDNFERFGIELGSEGECYALLQVFMCAEYGEICGDEGTDEDTLATLTERVLSLARKTAL